MQIIDKKPDQITENNFYGVDVNNKAKVQEEFNRLKKRHSNITILVVVVLIILGILCFDIVRVTEMGGKPILAIEQTVDGGRLFSGLGYKVLYCDSGERYAGTVLYNSCGEVDNITISNLVYQKFVDYSIDNKTLDKNKLKELTFNTVIVDGKNDKDGSDYFVNLSYECKEDNNKCFKTDKEYFDNKDVDLYVRLNKYNEVYSVVSFIKDSNHTKELNKMYTEKVKQYLIDNQKLTEDNLRNIEIKLTENHGRYKFRGIVYADSYLLEISYMCTDGSNECVKAFDKEDAEGDYSNLMYYASMFVDHEDNVMLVGPRQYLEL